MTSHDDAILRELKEALNRAGIEIPASRLAGMAVTYAELKVQLPLLRSTRDATAEPAGTYDLSTITRSGAA